MQISNDLANDLTAALFSQPSSTAAVKKNSLDPQDSAVASPGANPADSLQHLSLAEPLPLEDGSELADSDADATVGFLRNVMLQQPNAAMSAQATSFSQNILSIVQSAG